MTHSMLGNTRLAGTQRHASLPEEVLVQVVVGNVRCWQTHLQIVEAFFSAVFEVRLIHRR